MALQKLVFGLLIRWCVFVCFLLSFSPCGLFSSSSGCPGCSGLVLGLAVSGIFGGSFALSGIFVCVFPVFPFRVVLLGPCVFKIITVLDSPRQ